MLQKLRDPEFREAAPYFALGAVQGAYRYYVQPELTSKRGWFALATGVAVWNTVAPQGHSLSEGVDRALDANKALTTFAVGYVAAHLLNLIPMPDKLDVIHIVMDRVKG
jgi:hypothetical protein